MKTTRFAVLTLIAVVLVAMVSWWQGARPEGRHESADSAVPAVGRDDALSSTWFCSAGGLGAGTSAQHLLRLSNSSDRPADVRLNAYGAKGPAGSSVVKVPARTVHTVDVAATFKAADLSVVVESTDGSLAVEHGLVLKDMADVVPCATHSSDVWYFPTQTSVKGSQSLLVLFNPFSADASVVVSGAVADGVRAPIDWNGVVVPAGTTKVLNLGEQFSVRDQFSVTVKLKSGRVLAETAQVLDLAATNSTPAVHGLRLQTGVAAPRDNWTFAGGFRDPGAAEKIVVQNPGRDSARVSVQVVPYGAGDMAPEPFQLDVPAGRYALLDLAGEGRVPDVGIHSITVQSEDGHPVVAVRTISLSAAPTTKGDPASGVNRISYTTGAAVSIGSTFAGRRWLIPAVTTGPGNEPQAFVWNAQPGIAKISISAITDGGDAIEVLSNLEVAPGEGMGVNLMPKSLEGPAVRYYTIDSNEPVFVDRLVTFRASTDFSFGRALPVLPG